MRVTFEIDPASNAGDIIRHDIQTWLNFYGARDTCRIMEEYDEFEDIKLLTVDFRNALDATDFYGWCDIRRRARLSG